MKATLVHPNTNPQDFYFNMMSSGAGKADITHTNLDFDEAAMLHVYHEVTDHLCQNHGFKLTMMDAGGSCPKYVAVDGVYMYRATNYFVEVLQSNEALVYLCETRLVFDEFNFPDKIVFDFFDENKQLITSDALNCEISLRLLTVMRDVQGMDRVNDLVSLFFADAIMHLDGVVKSWGVCGDPAQRDTAYPDEMLFSNRLLTDVIIPKYAADLLGDSPLPIEKPVMSQSNADVGPNALLYYSFIVDGELLSGEVSLADYVREWHLATGGYPEYYDADTYRLTSWPDMYGRDLWIATVRNDRNR